MPPNQKVVVDRVVVKPESQTRIADSVELSLKQAEGLVLIDIVGKSSNPKTKKKLKSAESDAKEILFSEQLGCPDCGISKFDFDMVESD